MTFLIQNSTFALYILHYIRYFWLKLNNYFTKPLHTN
jgi:hypothetical protein